MEQTQDSAGGINTSAKQPELSFALVVKTAGIPLGKTQSHRVPRAGDKQVSFPNVPADRMF